MMEKAAINTQLTAFDTLLDAEVAKFNEEFNGLKLDYLFVEGDEE